MGAVVFEGIICWAFSGKRTETTLLALDPLRDKPVRSEEVALQVMGSTAADSFACKAYEPREQP